MGPRRCRAGGYAEKAEVLQEQEAVYDGQFGGPAAHRQALGIGEVFDVRAVGGCCVQIAGEEYGVRGRLGQFLGYRREGVVVGQWFGARGDDAYRQVRGDGEDRQVHCGRGLVDHQHRAVYALVDRAVVQGHRDRLGDDSVDAEAGFLGGAAEVGLGLAAGGGRQAEHRLLTRGHRLLSRDFGKEHGQCGGGVGDSVRSGQVRRRYGRAAFRGESADAGDAVADGDAEHVFSRSLPRS
ncbi:hypothetical protein SAZ11_00190 [Streptomyces sp. FXJ1.4098]|nr:hypothetical protein [Streptomyces sp. FXJ1.4098]